jgi:hypothetical protein
MTTFEFNDQILVKLTELGKQHYVKTQSVIFGSIGRKVPAIEEDVHGRSLWNFWEFVSLFGGPHIAHGGPEYFEKDLAIVHRGDSMKRGKVYSRIEDMSPDGRLDVYMQDDGDLILHVAGRDSSGTPSFASVEFCTLGSGGGRSPRTRDAIHELAIAMEKDNAERPIENPTS